MVMQQRVRAVGTFPNRQDAEAALNELRNSGFSMDGVSILAKNAEDRDNLGGVEVSDRGDNQSREGVGIGAVVGTALGGLGGLLVGLEALLIPGVGPFLAAGTIATTLAGAGIGAAAGGIVGALTGLGIPEEDAHAYNERVSQGDYLVMIEGTQVEIDRAGSILQNRGIRHWKVYDASHQPAYGDREVNVASTRRDAVTSTGTDYVEVVDKREQVL